MNIIYIIFLDYGMLKGTYILYCVKLGDFMSFKFDLIFILLHCNYDVPNKYSRLTHRPTTAGRLAKAYIYQLYADTGCHPEDLPSVMTVKDGCRRELNQAVLSARLDDDDDDMSAVYMKICITSLTATDNIFVFQMTK